MFKQDDTLLKAAAFQYWESIFKGNHQKSLLREVSKYPALEQAIADEGLKRGYSILKWDSGFKQFIGGNVKDDSSWKKLEEPTKPATIFDELNISPEEVDYFQKRKEARNRILDFFTIPPDLLTNKQPKTPEL